MKDLFVASLCSILGMIVTQGCEPDCKGCSPNIPLTSNLIGKWQWIKTITPTRTITPQMVGYKEELNYSNDGLVGNYIAYYRNDNLKLRLPVNRSRDVEENKDQNRILMLFGDKYIKFFLKKGKDNTFMEMETSQLMSNYSVTADTIRSYYQYVGTPRKE